MDIKKDFAEISVALHVKGTYFYQIKEELKPLIQIGSRVSIPFGKKNVTGYVIGFPREIDKNIKKIKEITNILDEESLFDETSLRFFRWISDYYFAPLGEVLKSALPSKAKLRIKKADEKELSKINIENNSFINKEGLGRFQEPKLTNEQNKVLNEIKIKLDEEKFSAILIHGVTGSGKTEIYLRTIEEVLRKKKQALLLVPEISLTPQVLNRFQIKFGDNIAILHSALSKGERYDHWMRIKKGELSIAIGARSGIFAPFHNLGIIIVDEEHDGSYKQEDRLRYNARDLALMRGKFSNCVVVLGSATPSIESYYRSETGKYNLLNLTKRVDEKPMPEVDVVDLRDELSEFNKLPILSKKLIHAIEDTLSKNDQIILFLNRRGFSNFLLCVECGHVPICKNCSVSLTQHLKERFLICHYCGYRIPTPDQCPSCKGLKIKQIGTGTEKLEAEINRLFPNATVERMDRDTTRRKYSHQNILKRFEEGKTKILIGTQMVAKGHDYPDVTLVGIINADVSLNFPDFRASERTFQLLTQVAGRAGRGKRQGKVIIQTFNPENFAIKCAINHDVRRFYCNELKLREELFYPPFSRLANIKISGKNINKTKDTAQSLSSVSKDVLKNYKELSDSINILGPTPAPIAKIKGKHQYHLLIKGKTPQTIHRFLELILAKIDSFKISSVKIDFDIDPQSIV